MRTIYTPKTVPAMNIAYDAHNGTYDKNGFPTFSTRSILQSR